MSILNDNSFEFTVFTPSHDDDGTDFTTLSLPQLTNTIRRNTRTLHNRLHSIHTDALFVASVARAYSLPLIPNARAGDWYVPPSTATGGVYFKSTDGHTNEWGFSLRRLNLSLLSIAAQNNGAIIVDSTRRGKRFPDSLSKTIPIWISILNAALFPTRFPTPALHTSPLAVAAHEAAAIEKLLMRFLVDFLALDLPLPPLAKPLRPLFITPASPLPESPPSFADFTPLVLVTASRITHGIGTEGEYIQGAGDDHEGWASSTGLTPSIFWAHHSTLLSASPTSLPAAIAAAIAAAPPTPTSKKATLIKPTSNIFISSSPATAMATTINLCSTPLPSAAANVPIPAGKRGNKSLRLALPSLISALRTSLEERRDIVFVCETGDDVAPVVALAFLCLFYGDDGAYLPSGQAEAVDKPHIRRRLAWISAARPTANPARGLLNAVNSVLMKRQ